MPSPIKPEEVPPHLASDYVRLSEEYLKSQLQVAIAYDARAMACAATFASIGVALLALDVTLNSLNLFRPMQLHAMFLFAATLLCLVQARPAAYVPAGKSPSALRFDVPRDTFNQLIAAHYDAAIALNTGRMKESISYYHAALIVAAFGTVFSYLWPLFATAALFYVRLAFG